MTHLSVAEWGSVAVRANTAGAAGAADTPAFTRAEANALLAAARAHPLANRHGSNILIDRHSAIAAAQMVGVIAAPGCSLEILPKIDSIGADGAIRQRLVRMLDVALGLQLGAGETAAMARQTDTLLDILIRLFADRLLAEVRRGLPRAYLPHTDDLPALRGRLDVRRQFTALAVRPDRLACHYDLLSADTPLLRIMKACVALLRRHARAPATSRRLDELQVLLADVSAVPAARLPWEKVRIDRSNRRWETLCQLARLFLTRQWQATSHDAAGHPGITLLFAMNDLFEAYVAALARRALRGSSRVVQAQGGGRCCLTEASTSRQLFRTRPDLLIRAQGRPALIIDTKWKRIAANPEDARGGVAQADVYQMMAYASLYDCPVTLLYPHHAGLGAAALMQDYAIAASPHPLRIASIDLGADEAAITAQLHALIAGAAAESRAA